MTKSYNTYIFDLDGTLLETLEDLTAAVNYAMRTHGMPEHSLADVRRFVGNGVKMLMVRAVPSGEANPQFEAAFATFRAYYMDHSLDTTRPYAGIPELLAELKSRGKRIAVVSNKFCAATQSLCRHFFPDTVIEALKQLGVGKENAVYVGDSEVDLQTARNAGLPCISVLWGFRDRDLLKENGATTFVAAPLDILSL